MMKQLIEIFRWGYEGEYDQYFYAVDSEKIDEFIKEANMYLKKVCPKREFFWNAPLDEYKPGSQIKLNFGPNIVIGHIEPKFHIVEGEFGKRELEIQPWGKLR